MLGAVEDADAEVFDADEDSTDKVCHTTSLTQVPQKEGNRLAELTETSPETPHVTASG
jgi:hypothetical protein